jgi:hypothetical protein
MFRFSICDVLWLMVVVGRRGTCLTIGVTMSQNRASGTAVSNPVASTGVSPHPL